VALAASTAQLERLAAILAGRGHLSLVCAGGAQGRGAIAVSATVASVGSALHVSGACRPCMFTKLPQGCKFGAGCDFCHVAGNDGTSEGRARPCKGKRDRVKKALAKVEEALRRDPRLFASGGFFLPPVVEQDPKARAEVMQRFSKVASDALAR